MKDVQEEYKRAIMLAEKNLDYGNKDMYEYWRKRAEEFSVLVNDGMNEESGES